MSLLIQLDLKSLWSGPGGNEDSENLVRLGLTGAMNLGGGNQFFLMNEQSALQNNKIYCIMFVQVCCGWIEALRAVWKGMVW